jgi:hypothetical protein
MMALRPDEQLPSIIGLTGYAQHGKDTVGGILTTLYGYHRFAFADQVRTLALRIDPVIQRDELVTVYERPDEYASGATIRPTYGRLSELVKNVGWEEAKAWPEVRRILVELGMGVRDVIGADSWVFAGANLASEFIPTPPEHGGVVFTDVRFPNEVRWVRDNGGVVIRITRPGVEAVPHDNAAEVHVPNLRANFDILNDGTVNELYLRVQAVMTDLREGFRGSET